MSHLALRHIDHLARVIGPRGTCTPQERQASDYCRRVLEDLGYAVRAQTFRAARSGWAPYSIGSGLLLLSLIVFAALPAAIGRPLAALVAVSVMLSTFLELMFRPNPLAWVVPKGWSQNVYAVAAPSGEPRRSVVISGHVDTHRTPVAMASPRAFRVFQGLVTLGVIALVALSVLLILLWIQPQPLWRELTRLPALIVAVVFVVTLQPEFSPYVPGANDNASGAAAVLALAARLTAEPLKHTRVWLLNSGAEETGATGPVQLLRRHPELKDADWLVLDTIAGPGAGPCLIVAEHLLLPLRADPTLLAAARAVASSRPNLDAYEHYYRGLFSEHSPLVVASCRSLALINFTPQGVLPNWHRPTDTVANIDPDVLDRTEQFVWDLLQLLDAPLTPDGGNGCV